MKFKTANIEYADSDAVAEVEVSFSNHVLTFILDEKKSIGDQKVICMNSSSKSSTIEAVRIRQSPSINDWNGWAVKSLEIQKELGSNEYVKYSLSVRNEIFWTDGDDNSCPNSDELLCCLNGEWCQLNVLSYQWDPKPGMYCMMYWPYLHFFLFLFVKPNSVLMV